MRLLADFEDMAITTFVVEPTALARHLPPDLVPHLDAAGRALVSAVSVRARRVRLRALPWPSLSYPQVNHRAYVRGPEGPAVWFFRMTVGSRALALSQRLRGLPMDSAAIEIETAWDGPRLRRYRLRQGDHAELDATGADASPFEGFTSAAEALEFLTQPMLGYGRTRGGRRARFRVDHARFTVARAKATQARFRVFEELGLVAPDVAPHSMLVVRHSEFGIEPPAID